MSYYIIILDVFRIVLHELVWMFCVCYSHVFKLGQIYVKHNIRKIRYQVYV